MLAATVRLARFPYRLTWNLRALYRFEIKMGRSLEQAAQSSPLATARTLLWAMASEVEDFGEVTEHGIGSMDAAAFGAAVEQVRLLLASSSPRRTAAAEAEDTAEERPKRVDWHQLWAIGRYDLQLPEAEFWRLSPAQFSALCDRMEAEREHAEYCAALVASTIANVNLAEGVEPVSADLFMRRRAKAALERRQINEAKAARENLRQIMGAIGARVVSGAKEPA